MVEFVTVKSTDVKFGKNNFIEISRKIAKTEEGDKVFVSLSRGFFAPTGEKRFKKNISMPNDPVVIDAIVKALADLKETEKK